MKFEIPRFFFKKIPNWNASQNSGIFSNFYKNALQKEFYYKNCVGFKVILNLLYFWKYKQMNMPALIHFELEFFLLKPN